MKGLYCDNYDCKNFGVNLLENNPPKNKCCKRVIKLHSLIHQLKTSEKTAILMANNFRFRNGIKPKDAQFLSVLVENNLLNQVGEKYHLTPDGRFCAWWLIDNDKEAEKFDNSL